VTRRTRPKWRTRPCYTAPMTSEGDRLRAHLQKVGEAKAASHADMAAAHLALSLGERLARVIEAGNEWHRLLRTASRVAAPRIDDEAEAWRRVYEKLHRGR
jgi:hypothetical protein